MKKHGKYAGKHYCMDCGKEVWDGNSKRCEKCWGKSIQGKPKPWLKNRIPWNKGLNAQTDERVQKYIEKSLETRKKKKKEKIKNYCIDCRKEIGKKSKRCRKCCNIFLGKKYRKERIYRMKKNNPMSDPETRKKQKENIPKGSYHHGWIPDREQVFAPYTAKFYDKNFRKRILKEQKSICSICKKKLDKGKIDFHHIDSNKQNDNKDNLCALHARCHNRTKGSLENRNYWKRILQNRRK